MQSAFDNPKPIAMPIMLATVNYDTAFPDISPTLLCRANLTFTAEREAAPRRKVTFLQAFAAEAKKRN